MLQHRVLFLNTDWKMIQLNVTCLFFRFFFRGVKYNLKYICCLLINFLGLVLRLKSARDSFVFKSCAQFQGYCEKEMVIEVTVMVVGEQVSFSEQ
jgi:hypothetical protein